MALFHQTGDGQAKDRFWRVDGVPTCQRDTRRVTHRTTAAYHFPGNFRRQHVHRPAQNRNRHQWVTAHGVDVADGIGGGNSAEIEGIVDDRHEKIRGRDHAAFLIDRIHRRVIARGIADPKLRVEVLRPAAGQDHFQHLGGNLATATGAVAVLGQANRLAHWGYLIGSMGPILAERGTHKALHSHGLCGSGLAREGGIPVTWMLTVPTPSRASPLPQGGGLWQQNHLVATALIHFGIALQSFSQW
ncbi:hypothetical protein D3C81_1424290 [compost metagenome]